MIETLQLEVGTRSPPGASVRPGGVNFSVYSPHATKVWLRLYRRASDKRPFVEFELDRRGHRTLHFWHAFVVGAKPGWCYTWRVEGPNAPGAGLRFDPTRELLDPWAELVAPELWNRAEARRGGRTAIRAEIARRGDYDWEGDAPLEHPLHDAIIYEMHVRGFTRHPSSNVEHPGTFAGVIEKIPYLQSLGITAVELMPVNAFDRQDVPPAAAKLGLVNYWGYSPYAYFAPEPWFSAGHDPRTEFRDMVKALHKAGIAVILDMVLNHTAEGGADGPTISFKGFANDDFYLLDPEDKRRYLDFTGCGNTVSCNHPIVARFIQQCLEYWVRQMHVDGFRIDLASVLTRGTDGEPLVHPPVLWALEFSEVLANSALIAEAWDAGGLYHVGSFPGLRWAEWNGMYRDSVRRFLRGDPGSIADVATRIAGSSDLYAAAGKTPQNGINFVTCHDGFTLYDLVSYDRKHNHANAENNHDGRDDNLSWNSGAEGHTADAEILRLRERRARNFMTVLALSQGVPMLLAGDEVLRTQDGNNNAYCQDNAISWFNWRFSEAAEAMLRFTREILALRKRHASLRRTRFIEVDANGNTDLRWYGETLAPPDWRSPDAKVLCFTLEGVTPDEPALHAMMNMSFDAKQLPLPPGRAWSRIVDTSRSSPDDIVPAGVPHSAPGYDVGPHTVVVFEAIGA